MKDTAILVLGTCHIAH